MKNYGKGLCPHCKTEIGPLELSPASRSEEIVIFNVAQVCPYCGGEIATFTTTPEEVVTKTAEWLAQHPEDE